MKYQSEASAFLLQYFLRARESKQPHTTKKSALYQVMMELSVNQAAKAMEVLLNKASSKLSTMDVKDHMAMALYPEEYEALEDSEDFNKSVDELYTKAAHVTLAMVEFLKLKASKNSQYIINDNNQAEYIKNYCYKPLSSCKYKELWEKKESESSPLKAEPYPLVEETSAMTKTLNILLNQPLHHNEMMSAAIPVLKLVIDNAEAIEKTVKYREAENAKLKKNAVAWVNDMPLSELKSIMESAQFLKENKVAYMKWKQAETTPRYYPISPFSHFNSAAPLIHQNPELAQEKLEKAEVMYNKMKTQKAAMKAVEDLLNNKASAARFFFSKETALTKKKDKEVSVFTFKTSALLAALVVYLNQAA